jgi:hypothetical protein
MQFNKASVYQTKEEDFTWGVFEKWADIERNFYGFWGVIPFPFAFVLPQLDFVNILGLHFVEINPQVISPKFIYPKQTMKKDYLYKVYGKVDDNWMIVGKALLCFSDVNFSGLNFISSLNLNLSSDIFTVDFSSSVYSDNNFNICSCIINKNIWVFFNNWVDMTIAKNNTWSG